MLHIWNRCFLSQQWSPAVWLSPSSINQNWHSDFKSLFPSLSLHTLTLIPPLSPHSLGGKNNSAFKINSNQFYVKYEYLFQALDPNQFQKKKKKPKSDSSLPREDDFLEAERFCALRNMSHQVQNKVPDAHCTPALRNKTHHHGAEQMHTHVNEQLNLGKSALKKKKKLFSGGFVVVFFCYPAYAALVNSQWVPSFKHIKRLGERLILQESKNRPNVFCCERFVETKWGRSLDLKKGKKKKNQYSDGRVKNARIQTFCGGLLSLH